MVVDDFNGNEASDIISILFILSIKSTTYLIELLQASNDVKELVMNKHQYIALLVEECESAELSSDIFQKVRRNDIK